MSLKPGVMENIYLKISLIIGAAIALPKMILGLFEFLKWLISITMLFVFPKRGSKVLKVMTKNYGKQTIFTSKSHKEEEKSLSPEPSG